MLQNEVRLINANALLEKRRSFYEPKELESIAPIARTCITTDDVYRAPTIDAAPVVHAEWEIAQVWKNNPQTTLRCSACKCSQPIYDHETWLYCPFCGAKMDGGDPR